MPVIFININMDMETFFKPGFLQLDVQVNKFQFFRQGYGIVITILKDVPVNLTHFIQEIGCQVLIGAYKTHQ